jgi:hypothetical protein
MTAVKKRDASSPAGMTITGVVELAGGVGAVAAACGVSRSAVSQWVRVPKQHIRTVRDLSGLPLSVLRPDLFTVPAFGVPV